MNGVVWWSLFVFVGVPALILLAEPFSKDK